MARQVKNILVGVGTIKLSGELDADLAPATPLADMGFTVDGVEVTLEPDIVDVTVDQFGDAARLIENSIKVMVKTTLAEATLANLAIAWGRPDAAYTAGTNGGTLELGVNATGKPAERQLQFIGKSPNGFDRTYTCWRAVSVSSSGHAYKRSEATLFPVEFRILPDAAHSGSEYGTVVDAES
jgi:hypothetical protein